jgi:hypothetical protein
MLGLGKGDEVRDVISGEVWQHLTRSESTFGRIHCTQEAYTVCQLSGNHLKIQFKSSYLHSH